MELIQRVNFWGHVVASDAFFPISSFLQLPGFCRGSDSVLGVQADVDCSGFLGHKAVYRMGFATAAFFFLFAMLMVCVRSSKDPRAAIQNA